MSVNIIMHETVKNWLPINKSLLYQNTPFTKIVEKKRHKIVIYHTYKLYKEFLEWVRKTKQAT